MNIKTHTFLPGQTFPLSLITPQQSHGAKILQIKTGGEILKNCDGIWTSNPQFLLGVRTADCAPICFWNNRKYGVLHAGWRGVVNGAVENMHALFETGLGTDSKSQGFRSPSRDLDPGINIWIGPILPRFEIQKDDCYQQILHKFGNQFFTEIKVDLETLEVAPNQEKVKSRSTLKVIFEFKKCLEFLLPNALFDDLSTYNTPELASWRRDKKFPNGQNVTVIAPAAQFEL